MKCRVVGCDGSVKARGLCQKHYTRALRSGEIENYKGPGRGKSASKERVKCAGVAECGRRHLARGLCSACYQHQRNSGEIQVLPKRNSGSCSVEGCGKEAKTKGYCTAHYFKWRKYGDPLASAPPKTGVPCSVAGCARKTIARGLCSAHYAKLQKHGDPLFESDWFKKRFGPIVDETGYVHVYDPEHPNAHKSGRVPEHRKVMADLIGRPLKENENVHHKNGVRSDNRPENLEIWVSSQPSGQRRADLVEWACRILADYGHEVIVGDADREPTGGWLAEWPSNRARFQFLRMMEQSPIGRMIKAAIHPS